MVIILTVLAAHDDLNLKGLRQLFVKKRQVVALTIRVKPQKRSKIYLRREALVLGHESI